ncbi:hypothetical protein KV097_05995 [Mumia sp. zg.B17]|uniref:hypothetical protein n=1 Tax=Mumia sp. zg.B17 TaxID=2855446 RepID=UPI001C6E6074|nr:hypothetical protein [Mumia sp. zg.B17]MBW9205493.1 hypothetical protein [Mumia sp. zg.B17]
MGPLPLIRTCRLLVTGTAAALVVSAAASPAAAETRVLTDPRHDAAAALDLTKVTVANTKRAVVVRITVPRLRRSKLAAISVVVRTRAAGRPEFVSLRTRGVARWDRAVLTDDTEATVRCSGDRVRIGKRSVTVRLPQRCLGGNRRAVRVGVALVGTDLKGVGPLEVDDPGPRTAIDVFPRLDSDRLSQWVRYR